MQGKNPIGSKYSLMHNRCLIVLWKMNNAKQIDSLFVTCFEKTLLADKMAWNIIDNKMTYEKQFFNNQKYTSCTKF